MIHKLVPAMLTVALVAQVASGQDRLPIPKGPPPRFITVTSVNQAKGEAIFDIQVVAQNAHDQPTVLVYPGGESRLTLGMNPSYLHLAEGFKVPLKSAKWTSVDGEEVGAETAAKKLKPGVTVLLSADGAAVDGTFLRMFKAETLVLIVPIKELPVPYLPHVGGAIPVRNVGER